MTNHKIGHTEKWLEKRMGREWVMKKLLMEIIAHFDMENYDLCENLVRSIQNRFRDLLNTEKYARAKDFIKISSDAQFTPTKEECFAGKPESLSSPFY